MTDRPLVGSERTHAVVVGSADIAMIAVVVVKVVVVVVVADVAQSSHFLEDDVAEIDRH